MLKFKRVFAVLLILAFFISSSVLATDETTLSESLISTLAAPDTTSTTPAETINEDCYIYNSDSYTLDNIIYGNVFASTTRFTTNPRNGGGIISGNLFLISQDTTIASKITYSNNTDSNGNYIISSIDSKSIINGNAYILSDTFTIESGSEIHGDLYIVGNKINIQQDCIIDGNVFITAKDVTINGQITGSAYISTENLNMNYFAYITRDLFLTSENATLSGIVYRNAFITSYNLSTDKDFRNNGNLSVNYAKDCSFSGEVYGDAKINAETLTFKNDDSIKCEIQGNLKYSTKNEAQIPDGVVKGEVSTEKFVNKEVRKFHLGETIISLLSLIVYIFVIVALAKKFTPEAINKLPELNVKNCLISLGIGLISFIAILILFVLSIISTVGMYVAFALVVAYLFILAISVPLFIYKIADLIKLNWNIYLKLLAVVVIFYVIKFVPILGALVSFVVFTSGIGQIILGLLKKNK